MTYHISLHLQLQDLLAGCHCSLSYVHQPVNVYIRIIRFVVPSYIHYAVMSSHLAVCDMMITFGFFFVNNMTVQQSAGFIGTSCQSMGQTPP